MIDPRPGSGPFHRARGNGPARSHGFSRCDAMTDANRTAEQLDTAPAPAPPPDDRPPIYVAGVGASAGGLEALERLFARMPAETGIAFVVVQHLSPDFKSLTD